MPDPTQHTTTTQCAGQPGQSYGQRERPKVYPRPGSDETDPYGISLASSRARRHRRDSDRDYPGPAIPMSLARPAPLDYVRLPKMLGDGNYIALNNKAPHPNAGELFIDYFLDDESMKIMAKLGEFVAL
jgi:hypothetical protein